MDLGTLIYLWEYVNTYDARSYNKIQFIQRVGTGSSSESSPCSLTFDFAPSYIMLAYI